jgi:hypothetical protein
MSDNVNPEPEATEVSQAEFDAAKAAADEPEVDRTNVPDDVPDDVVKEHNEGSGSWWSDPAAMSSDPTAAAASADKGEASGSDNVAFDVRAHNVSEVVAYATEHPELVDDLLAQEKATSDPRSTLVAQLEAMQT